MHIESHAFHTIYHVYSSLPSLDSHNESLGGGTWQGTAHTS